MRKMFLAFLVLGFGSFASAQQVSLGVPSLYEFVAPSVFGTPDQVVVGQIFYDTDTNSFKGVLTSGSVVSLSLPGGLNAVSSGGTSQKIESLKVNHSCTSSPCTINGASSSWVASIGVTRNSTGSYTITYTNWFNSTAPICVATCGNGTNTYNTSIGNPTATSATVICDNGNGAAVDTGFNLICMGSN